jgi:hypothetical protein
MHEAATLKDLSPAADTMGSATANRDFYTSLSCFLWTALDTLNHADLDGIRLLADAGITVRNYEQNGRRAPTDVIAKAWQVVAENIDDPAAGVRAAFRHFNPADWQSLGLAIQNNMLPDSVAVAVL